MNHHPPDLIGYDQAAVAVGRSRRSIERAVASGRLRRFEVITGTERRMMVSATEVLAYYADRHSVQEVAS